MNYHYKKILWILLIFSVNKLDLYQLTFNKKNDNNINFPYFALIALFAFASVSAFLRCLKEK